MKVPRPSAPMAIALLALFVALDGPAHAGRLINGKLLRKGTVTSRAIKDRSVQVEDLHPRTVRTLKAVPNNSITEAKLANGSVTPGKLARGAVGSEAIEDRSVMGGDLSPSSVGTSALVDGSITGAKIATGAIDGGKIADGSLDARDVARFHGRFRTTIGPVERFGTTGACWSAAIRVQELVGADVSQDLVVVTPGPAWPERQLTFSVRNDGDASRFVIAACNLTSEKVDAREVGFRYAVIDLP